ncbi:hypothetical protein [Arthrobacter sp. MMS18-M83]|uniref:hypothetical protein n=1 Tax=Arthrobacter sp. MMS18-M83 TaxID=2996261 RepID=UPI00227C18A5|nr:hypothetical protein [Arthrobacter sp. MMS18-M83]WAH99157.1 hypothetical protein OW521_10185 [Arthrobacter sp. MMS18-M83]
MNAATQEGPAASAHGFQNQPAGTVNGQNSSLLVLTRKVTEEQTLFAAVKIIRISHNWNSSFTGEMITWHSNRKARSGGFRLKLSRRFSVALLVGLLIGTGAGIAQASTVYGSLGYLWSDGIEYENQATAENDNWPGYVDTWIYTADGHYAPMGYLGADARSFLDDGTTNPPMCADHGYHYNTSSTPQFNDDLLIPCGLGYYFSWGVTATYNGNGYDYYYTNKSPNIYAGG